MLHTKLIKTLVSQALEEDIGSGDITAQLIPAGRPMQARVITREEMVVCGQVFVDEVFNQVDDNIEIIWKVTEGQKAPAGQVLFWVKGEARSLLTAERTALNFLQMLSGTATITQRYVEQLKGTRTQLLDTRKTIPLFRLAQKYAVTCGGGVNHRKGLYDAFLIKENHIMACGSIQAAIDQAHQIAPGKSVEIEVENLLQLNEAIAAGAEIVMLDNFNLQGMREAVKLAAGRVKLEVSGNVTLSNIRKIAETGVDFISSGSLTKHIQAIDLSMRIVDAPNLCYNLIIDSAFSCLYNNQVRLKKEHKAWLLITFDTLKYSKKLVDAGVPNKQAEAQAEALATVIEDQIPTKHDFKMLETSIDYKIETLETRILSKLGGLILICTALIGMLIGVHH